MPMRRGSGGFGWGGGLIDDPASSSSQGVGFGGGRRRYFRAGDLALCPTRSPRHMGVLRKRLKGGQRRTGGCIIRMVECWGGGVLCAQVIVTSMRRMRSFEHKVEDMKAGTGVCTRAAASARRPKKSTRCFL